MDRIYKRNILSQQVSFKLHYLLNQEKQTEKNKVLRLLLMLALDVLVGVVILDGCGIQWERLVRGWLTGYMNVMFQWTHSSLEWMESVPIGLKLNNQLIHFIVHKFSYILNLWNEFYGLFSHRYLQVVLNWLLICRYFGFSIFLASCHDFLKFLNLYLICYYIIILRILLLQTTGLLSLWRLFKGQKFNPLRKRVDSCNYDTNQLLLGTLLFTILLFLYPTTLVLYVVFFTLRCAQFSIQYLIRSFIVLTNKLNVFVSSWLLNSLATKKAVDISTATFKVLQAKNGGNDEENAKIIVTAFISDKYFDNLSELETFLVKSKSAEEHSKENSVNAHPLLQWFDISCF